MSAEYEFNYFKLHPYSPTLRDLIAFTDRHAEYFTDIDTRVLAQYDKTSREQWAKGRYYLYGHLPVFPDTPISNQLLNDATSIWKQRIIEYGIPYNETEAVEFEQNVCQYAELITIISRYQHAYKEIMYVDGTKTKYTPIKLAHESFFR